MIHKLKIINSFFEPVIRGEKSFEIRNNIDRGFQKGDTVELIEIEKGHVSDRITGRCQLLKITYVSNYLQPLNQVVFGFSLIGDVITD